jgi:hypothetical protein
MAARRETLSAAWMAAPRVASKAYATAEKWAGRLAVQLVNLTAGSSAGATAVLKVGVTAGRLDSSRAALKDPSKVARWVTLLVARWAVDWVDS